MELSSSSSGEIFWNVSKECHTRRMIFNCFGFVILLGHIKWGRWFLVLIDRFECCPVIPTGYSHCCFSLGVGVGVLRTHEEL